MPAKNSIKEYVQNGYYHIYNRGVDKRTIFQDDQDYNVFQTYLKDYLTPKDNDELRNQLSNVDFTYKDRDLILKRIALNNFYQKVTMLAYCLMPNHFHFLVKQDDENSIDSFMNSLGTRYTMYFNRKYQRVGPLYQDVYKAVLVSSDEQLVYLSKYIHRQALFSGYSQLLSPQPSSYYCYIGKQKIDWVDQNEILSFFSKTLEKSFLTYEQFISQGETIEAISKLAIDE